MKETFSFAEIGSYGKIHSCEFCKTNILSDTRFYNLTVTEGNSNRNLHCCSLQHVFDLQDKIKGL